MQAITGNYFVATPHRVITAEPRLSAGYFHGPSLDTRLDPLPLDPPLRRGASPPARAIATPASWPPATRPVAGVGDMRSTNRPDTYGEQLWNYFARSYPDNMARHYPVR